MLYIQQNTGILSRQKFYLPSKNIEKSLSWKLPAYKGYMTKHYFQWELHVLVYQLHICYDLFQISNQHLKYNFCPGIVKILGSRNVHLGYMGI